MGFGIDGGGAGEPRLLLRGELDLDFLGDGAGNLGL